MSDHCPKCNTYLTPGASACASCGFVLGEDERSPRPPTAAGSFIATCMVLLGGIIFVVGCIMSSFSITAVGILGGSEGTSVGAAILITGILIAVVGYFITKAGLAKIYRGRIQ